MPLRIGQVRALPRRRVPPVSGLFRPGLRARPIDGIGTRGKALWYKTRPVRNLVAAERPRRPERGRSFEPDGDALPATLAADGIPADHAIQRLQFSPSK